MADVTLTYKGNTIAELSASGSKTLETAGKYCEADILLEYVKSGGGGASLPSIISKIDGGSFTPSSDTQCSTYSISHNLGVAPKGFVIWTEDTLNVNVATRYMANAFLTITDVTRSNATHYDAIGAVSILYNGNTSITNATLASSAIDDYMDASAFTWNNNLIYFKSGLTYKWLVWA